MRRLTTSVAILFAAALFSLPHAMAKGPGNGSKGAGNSGSGQQSSGMQNSGQQNSGQQGNKTQWQQGTTTQQWNQKSGASDKSNFAGDKKDNHDSGHYRWDNDRWWYWGPGGWAWWNDGQWENYYYTARPILENFSGNPIKIVNPEKIGVTLNYSLNGVNYSIPPGYSQDLVQDRTWTIRFSRGPSLGQAEYGLEPGLYKFARTDHGWELFHSDLPQATAPSLPGEPPANPSAASMNAPATPTNPPANPAAQ